MKWQLTETWNPKVGIFELHSSNETEDPSSYYKNPILGAKYYPKTQKLIVVKLHQTKNRVVFSDLRKEGKTLSVLCHQKIKYNRLSKALSKQRCQEQELESDQPVSSFSHILPPFFLLPWLEAASTTATTSFPPKRAFVPSKETAIWFPIEKVKRFDQTGNYQPKP